MRTKNSIKNIYISLLTQIVIVILGFISRKVFINSLGTEYLGINGLLTNILSMLSLVEGGIGTSIVYNLYKPLAQNDKDTVISLVQLYKRLYGIIAVIVFILGILIYPFLSYLIKDELNIQYINIIYFLFILKNVISYLNAHKWSLINADQKGYIIAKYNLLFNITITFSKIIMLILTQNYIFYLLIEIFIIIVQNIWNGRIVNKNYPYINTKTKYNIDNVIKDNLITNVKALFLHNVGSYCVFGTDNILISRFIGIKVVGIYSNYTMITGQLAALLSPILGGVGHSIGNLIVTESNDKKYEIFNIMYLVNFWIYSICSIVLYNLTEPFIIWWLGNGLVLDKLTLVVIIINFYITGMRSTILTFKSKAGIFTDDKYIPLIEAIINLVGSIILVQHLGLVGILLGTTISTICIPLWIQPKLVYNKIFNKSTIEYFKKYVSYMIITIISGVITTYVCSIVYKDIGFPTLIIKGLICIIIPNIIFISVFFKTKEFKYLFNLIRKYILKLPLHNKIFN